MTSASMSTTGKSSDTSTRSRPKPAVLSATAPAMATVELRVPLTSPLSFGRGGVHFFYDTAAVYDDGESFGNAQWHHGVGTGFFFNVAIIGVRVDVGWDLEGETRFHIENSMKF